MPHNDLLAVALAVFRERGYAGTTLEQVAQRAQVDSQSLQARYADTAQLFAVLLHAYSPLDAIETALDAAQGETVDDLLRDVFHRLVSVAQAHRDFFELALIDAQVNDGAYLSGLNARIFPKAMQLLEKMKATGELRPVPDAVLGRTLIALLFGFLISERAVPQVARLAMRIIPQRAWLDGMIDLLLYGMIEDEARQTNRD